MDLLSRLSTVLEVRCPVCEAVMEGRLCPSCHHVVVDEQDSMLDMVVGGTSARIASGQGGKNLHKLLASLDRLERGESSFAEALLVVGPILGKFVQWHETIMQNPEETLTTPDEIQMRRDYLPLCQRTIALLTTYRDALQDGDLGRARFEMTAIAEEMCLLKTLREHYAALGF